MKKHNGFLSLSKFIFCIAIALFHVRYFAEAGEKFFFNTGYIFTEFFFIVSGFFMAKKCYSYSDNENNLGTETIKYILAKLKVFFPFVLLAHICGLIIKVRFENIGLYDIVTSVWNMFLLQLTGVSTYTGANVPVWYISAMLLCMLIIYPMLRKFRDNYALIAAPAFGLFLMGYLSQAYPTLNLTFEFKGLFCAGIIRAFAEINLGIVAFKLSEQIKQIKPTLSTKVSLTIISTAGIIAPLYVTTYISNASRYDFVIVLLFFISVAVAGSGQIFNSILLNNNFVYYLERLSLPVYVNHYFVRFLAQYIFNDYIKGYYTRIAIYLLVTVIISIIELAMFDLLRKKPTKDFLANNRIGGVLLPIFLVALVIISIAFYTPKPSDDNKGGVNPSVSDTTGSSINRDKISFITPNGDDQAYHPKVISFDSPWNGYKYWAAFTPYPNADATKENPVINASNDMISWCVPKGLTNPLDVPEKSNELHYNSDTHLLYNDEKERLEIFWRYVDEENGSVTIFMKTSSDGVNWSDKQVFLYSEKRKQLDYVSPSIIYEKGIYRVWYVNKLKLNYIEIEQSIISKPTIIDLEFDDPLVIWHLDVIFNTHKEAYEIIANAYNKGESRAYMDLYYCSSQDNINYTKPIKVLSPSNNDNTWDSQGLYRGSLLFENGKYFVFYSAHDKYMNVGIGLACGEYIEKLQIY